METQEQQHNRSDLRSVEQGANTIREAIGQYLVGQSQMVDLLLTAILSDGHVLIEGVPGVAKTMAAKLLAGAIDAPFSRIQFTPDLMPSDVLGTMIFDAKESKFSFRRGPIFSNIVLIDEINRAPAKTQSALFEVMQERQVTIDGRSMPMDEPFIVIATQNPIEQEGTYRLPEAQLDRFLFKIVVDYPNLEDEIKMLSFHQTGTLGVASPKLSAVLSTSNIAEMRAAAKSVHVEDKLLDYIARIVRTSRSYYGLFLGASPRAAVNLLYASKSWAAIHGRDFTIPQDIKDVAPSVLAHKLILTAEKEMEGTSAGTVVNALVESVEVPR